MIVLLLSSQSWETLQQPRVSESDFPIVTNPTHNIYQFVLITDMSYLIIIAPLCLLSKDSVVENYRGAISAQIKADYVGLEQLSDIYHPKQMCTITGYTVSVQDIISELLTSELASG